MNKCVFTGRLTREPKYLEKTEEEDSFLAYTVAITNGYGDTAKTFFMNCTSLGLEADRQKKILYKGVKVIISGEIYCYTSNKGDSQIAMSVKECEILQHTKAYMESHISELELQRKEEIRRATQRKNREEKESKKVKQSKEDKEDKEVRDWYNDDSDYYDRKKVNKLGIEEDKDGFMVINEGDVDLPFD